MRPMPSKHWLLTVIMAGGCLAEGQGLIEGGPRDAGVTPDGPAAELPVDVLEPAAGASVPRGYLAGDGTWMARVSWSVPLSRVRPNGVKVPVFGRLN